jgi:2-polyprenyl-3-methyl-5-hydroxy-6-metoxy-1,4-benzoquinol methylase
MRACAICGGRDQEIAYRGRIRVGGVGSLSVEEHEVLRCLACGVRWIDSRPESESFYQSEQYRVQLGQDNTLETYQRRHDPELNYLLEVLPMESYRDRVVLDVGCGGGSFLDAVRGLAATTVAVDPNVELLSGLARRGHTCFGTLQQLLESSVRVDIATSFNVIEHVEDPLSFLIQVRQSLKVSGFALIMTPNAKDFLLTQGPNEYREHFYRSVHYWYFDAFALEAAMRNAGFTQVRVGFVQTYGLSNALHWMRDRRGRGHEVVVDDSACDWAWKQYLVRTGQADRLYCIAS